MNPFTRFLSQWTRSRPDLVEFIAHWDILEALAIQVYKAAEATAEDNKSYLQVQSYMQANYVNFSEQLREYWEQSKVGGKLDHVDPFEYLFQYESAAGFVGNWAALQHLPAAREALNVLLVQISTT
ncbi:MAG: hypothetical protein ACI85U_003987 [Candidatus Promineifilaceae bacterium]|jgi:hypothetical protein